MLSFLRIVGWETDLQIPVFVVLIITEELLRLLLSF